MKTTPAFCSQGSEPYGWPIQWIWECSRPTFGKARTGLFISITTTLPVRGGLSETLGKGVTRSFCAGSHCTFPGAWGRGLRFDPTSIKVLMTLSAAGVKVWLHPEQVWPADHRLDVVDRLG